jgi:hypothetical protein
LQIESAGFEVGGESEVVEVAKAAGAAFSQLQQTVDGFHEAFGQFGFHVSRDAVAMAFEGSATSRKAARCERSAQANHPSSCAPIPRPKHLANTHAKPSRVPRPDKPP